jgi:predicted ribosomally synthesized peptide with nif11-like leader
MSDEAVAKFLELVATDEAVGEAMDAAGEQRADVAAAAVKLGHDHGLEFTGDEFTSVIETFYREHPGELDPAELEGVSGGFNPQPEPPAHIGHPGPPRPPWFSRSWASRFRGR